MINQLRVVKSLRFRYGRWVLGLNRPPMDPQNHLRLIVAGEGFDVRFPDDELDAHYNEANKILIDDCYGLKQLPRDIQSIIDVGANCGLFSIAARRRFPRANIHCYEPNPALQAFVQFNLRHLAVQQKQAALGDRDGFCTLNFKKNSLHTTCTGASSGHPMKTLASAVREVGGSVDLLKLDCEGAEWLLFEDPVAWQSVRYLTMEYHLRAKAGLSVSDVERAIHRLRFEILHHAPEPSMMRGMLLAKRESGL